MGYRNRIGRNDPCHCNSGLKYKNCCRKLDASNASAFVKPQQAIDNWGPGKLKRNPNEPRTQSAEVSVQLAVNQPIDHAAKEAGLESRWGASRVESFVSRVQQLASVSYERWELSIIDDISSKLPMQAGQIRPKHICNIYWNEIDQNFYCFCCEILNLISDQIRRFYLQFDDHICVAMQARQLIEATLAACANQFVAFLCFNPFPRMLDSREFGFVEWKRRYEYAYLYNGWSRKQRRAIQSNLGSDLAIPNNLLKTDFEPTCQRLFTFTLHFAEYWEDKVRSQQMNGEIKQLQRCYRYLCKFVPVTPQAFRSPETRKTESPN